MCENLKNEGAERVNINLHTESATAFGQRISYVRPPPLVPSVPVNALYQLPCN